MAWRCQIQKKVNEIAHIERGPTWPSPTSLQVKNTVTRLKPVVVFICSLLKHPMDLRIAHMFGLIEGRRLDAFMLTESGLEQKLTHIVNPMKIPIFTSTFRPLLSHHQDDDLRSLYSTGILVDFQILDFSPFFN
jgi:hypothetical protein